MKLKKKRKIKSKYKLVNKGKFFIMLIIIIIPILLLIFTTTVFAQETKEKNHKVIIVHHSDTLWDIAKENINEKQDLRYYIFKIKKLNNLEDSILYIGQKILLP